MHYQCVLTRRLVYPATMLAVLTRSPCNAGRKLYNLEPFLEIHPGGAQLLELAWAEFGDSTYAFESHHNDVPHALRVLEKYAVGAVEASVPGSVHSTIRAPTPTARMDALDGAPCGGLN